MIPQSRWSVKVSSTNFTKNLSMRTSMECDLSDTRRGKAAELAFKEDHFEVIAFKVMNEVVLSGKASRA